ncbi:3'-5' exonuclease [Polymorphospora sp. NPDC051019]|uniref:3'-5' exonuclease n=1 Tax=Polymorphospora sp. NPDC051019 TaxID=3155725 RepID=UPI0034378AC3
MASHLTDDPAYANTRFLVIDFEATTPTGRRPEPIDVAVIALRLHNGHLTETSRTEALIQPPAHAPLTRFDIGQTGITGPMLAGQPDAATVLARLDARLDDSPYLLVAHHAPTEAGILYDYRDHCPHLAATDFLDTLRLARIAYPDLPSHRLDVLIHHLGIPWPPGRHRAMPDVEVTAQVFRQIVAHGASTGHWRTLRQLREIGGYPAKGSKPEQETLF